MKRIRDLAMVRKRLLRRHTNFTCHTAMYVQRSSRHVITASSYSRTPTPFATSVTRREFNRFSRLMLRFRLGDKVDVFNTNSWKHGTVVMLNYNDWLWPHDWTAPYQIMLEGSSVLLYVPEDSDLFIRDRSPQFFSPDREAAYQSERKRREKLKSSTKYVRSSPCR